MPYALKKDLGIKGFQHNCLYSNGKVYSVNSTELCPIEIEAELGSPANTAAKQTGFKTGEYQDGMTKICVYSVMGRTEKVRFDLTDLCPLSYDF